MKTITRTIVVFDQDKAGGYDIYLAMQGYEQRLSTSATIVEKVSLGYCRGDELEAALKIFKQGDHHDISFYSFGGGAVT